MTDLETIRGMLDRARVFTRVQEHWGRHPAATSYYATDLSGTSFLESTDIIASLPEGENIVFSFYKDGQLLRLEHSLDSIKAWDLAGTTCLDTRYGRDDAEALARRLSEAERDCDYCDNARIAAKDDKEEMHAYEYIQSSGCCGSHDEDFRGPSGRLYMVGFNYGH